jgi:two-component system, LuxR family, response regulator FixJ
VAWCRRLCSRPPDKLFGSVLTPQHGLHHRRQAEHCTLDDEATIFLVDDDSAALRALTTLVKVVFPRVRAFGSASEFLAAYRDHQSGCLVLDVAMPGMSGLELHRKLIRDKINLPVIYVTGHGNVSLAVEAMQMGAIDFLEKPVQEHRLWDSIRKALELDGQIHRRRERRQHAEERMAKLTAGERAVLSLILEGRRNKEIAAQLNLSTRSIEDRRARIMKKMGAASLAELVQLVMTH